MAESSPGYAVEVKREGQDILTYWTHCPPQSFVRRLIAEDEDLGDLDAFYESWWLYDCPAPISLPETACKGTTNGAKRFRAAILSATCAEGKKRIGPMIIRTKPS
ncbi:MAG: hypothetical protein ABIW33_00625 [Sphingomicrobium sp.]